MEEEGGESIGHIRAVIAHGTLMIAAFALFLPLGALLARHKWAFGRKQGGISKLWFMSHVGSQALGAAAALAGLIIALVTFGDDGSEELWHPHKVIGIVAVAMVLFQALAAAAKPRIGSKARTAWNIFHHNWGRLAVLLGIANLFIGSVLVNQIYEQPLWAYAGATLGLVGLFFVLFLLLEPLKMRLQRRGRYSAATHAYAPKGATIDKQEAYAHDHDYDGFGNTNATANTAGNANNGNVFYAEGGPARLPADMEVGLTDHPVRR
jgi:membrane protease YdiL (CAAX protease family)